MTSYELPVWMALVCYLKVVKTKIFLKKYLTPGGAANRGV